MNNERMQVLQMVADGRISAEDAERLLEKMQAGGPKPHTSAHASAASYDVIAVSPSGEAVPRPGLRFLRILVSSAKEDQVNISTLR